MAPIKNKKGAKKTRYPAKRKTPEEKIKALGYWTLPVKIDGEVAEKILKDANSSKFGAAEYGQVINARLREAYKMPAAS